MLMGQLRRARRSGFHAKGRQGRPRIELEAALHGMPRRLPSLQPSARRATARPGARLGQDARGLTGHLNGPKAIEVETNADEHGIAAETLPELIPNPGSLRDQLQLRAI